MLITKEQHGYTCCLPHLVTVIIGGIMSFTCNDFALVTGVKMLRHFVSNYVMLS